MLFSLKESDMIWDCPSCGTKGLTGDSCPTCGSIRPVDLAGQNQLDIKPMSTAETMPAPTQPWTLWRIVYGILALIGGFGMMIGGTSRTRSRDFGSLRDDPMQMAFYVLFGGVTIFIGVVFVVNIFKIISNKPQTTSLDDIATTAEKTIITDIVNKNLGAWQEDHSIAVHRFPREKLDLDPTVRLVEIDYGYCDIAHFYVYAIKTMSGNFDTGAAGTALAYITPSS